MPFTSRQIARILSDDLLTADRVPNLSQRVCESWLKRRLFVWEDQTAAQQWDMYKQAHRELRIYANDLAAALDISTLGNDPASRQFRARFMPYAGKRLRQLALELAKHAAQRALVAYYAGYYGRAWELDMMTRRDVAVNAPVPTTEQAMRAMLEADGGLWTSEYDLLFKMLGQEWRDTYALELDDLLLKLQRTLNRGLREGHTIPQFMRDVRGIMGISTDRRQGYKANFHRVQTISRTYVMNSSNLGAMRLYNENSDIVLGAEHLTAEDERVCSLCDGLNGHIYELDDLFVPPSNTHPNCRCTVIAVVVDSLLTDEFAPPRQTFDEWATAISALEVAVLLAQFLGLRTLESDRV